MGKKSGELVGVVSSGGGENHIKKIFCEERHLFSIKGKINNYKRINAYLFF